jgi:hypothetical protein
MISDVIIYGVTEPQAKCPEAEAIGTRQMTDRIVAGQSWPNRMSIDSSPE